MKKKYLILGSFAFSLAFTRAQSPDSTFPNINKTEIEILYNQYSQDGNHSAVTGGTGTEKLTVYGPSLSYKRSSGKNIFGFQLGSDIISSASTDNIDFVISSASRMDTRSYTDINYTRLFEKSGLAVNAGLGLSIESDYFSFAKYLGISKASDDKMRNFFAQIQLLNDDLRWGRLNPDYYKPVKLIYPVELRDQDWFDIYHRYSGNLNIGFTQITDRQNILGIFTYFGIQEGLLSTPFHRIYFNDSSLAVEKLPDLRIKGSLAFRWNRFLNGNIVIKNALGGYIDNFGIVALWIENETAVKLGYQWTIIPNLRIYSQKGSGFFAPYKEHTVDEEFYTSDYDLSPLSSGKFGVGIRYKSLSIKKLTLNAITARYFFYTQSNGLAAHALTLLLNFHFKHETPRLKKASK